MRKLLILVLAGLLGLGAVNLALRADTAQRPKNPCCESYPVTYLDWIALQAQLDALRLANRYYDFQIAVTAVPANEIRITVTYFRSTDHERMNNVVARLRQKIDKQLAACGLTAHAKVTVAEELGTTVSSSEPQKGPQSQNNAIGDPNNAIRDPSRWAAARYQASP